MFLVEGQWIFLHQLMWSQCCPPPGLGGFHQCSSQGIDAVGQDDMLMLSGTVCCPIFTFLRVFCFHGFFSALSFTAHISCGVFWGVTIGRPEEFSCDVYLSSWCFYIHWSIFLFSVFQGSINLGFSHYIHQRMWQYHPRNSTAWPWNSAIINCISRTIAFFFLLLTIEECKPDFYLWLHWHDAQ